jgi:hypothetical protein
MNALTTAWVLLNVATASATIYLGIQDARDYRTLVRLGRNGIRRFLALDAIRRDAVRIIVHLVLVAIGLYYGLVEHPGGVVLVVGLMLAVFLLAAQAGTDVLARRHVLGLIEEREDGSRATTHHR